MGYVQTFAKEWPLITAAPWSFAVAVLAAAGLVWVIVHVYVDYKATPARVVILSANN